MKKNIIRAFSLILALAMVASCFAGCRKVNSDGSSWYSYYSDYDDDDLPVVSTDDTQSSDNQQTQSNTSQTSKPQSTTSTPTDATTSKTTNLSWKEVKASIPSNLKGTTVTVYSWNEVTDVTGAKDVISKFTKETGIKVEWKVGSFTNYATEIAAKVASNQAPDVIRMYNYNIGLMSLLTPLNETGYNFNDEAWDKSVMNAYSYNGKSYATNMQNTLLQQPTCLLYNRQLVSKYDLEDPYALWKKGQWTWDKFVEVCTDFKDQADDSSLAWTTYQWSDIGDIMGVGFTKFDGKTFTNNMNNSDLLKSWQIMSELQQQGITNKIRFDRTNFESGKVLFFTESPIGARRTHYYFSSLKSTGSLAAVPMPTMSGYTNLQKYGEYEAYAMPKGSSNKLASCYFLRYYLDADNYDENTFFADKTILEVYKEMRKNTNIYINYDSAIIDTDSGDNNAFNLYASVLYMEKAQVKTKIDEFVPRVNNAIKLANEKLSTIK